MLLKKRKEKYIENSERWWGYLHRDGTVHVKFYHLASQLTDANESDLVKIVIPPISAHTRQEAVKIIVKKIEDANRKKKSEKIINEIKGSQEKK